MENTIKQFNPATGEALASVQLQSAEGIPMTVARARVAQAVWAKLSYKERAKHIMKIQRFLADNVKRAVKIISSSTGKAHQDVIATEVLTGVLSCQWYAENTAKVLQPQPLPCGTIIFRNKTNTLYYEPLGVVGIISPWNYPFSIPFGEIIMGLMAGNAVILKVASNVVHVGNFIEECMCAGQLPNGLFQHVVVSGSEVGKALLSNGIDKLFFTGSVNVGKQLMAEAAKTLTPVSLELGGNDAMVVLADASIERAVNCACWAGFQNAGQSCGGVERVFVHRSIYDEFLKQLIAKTNALRHGPDNGKFKVDIGSVTTEGQWKTIKAQVDEAVQQGARIVAQSQPVGDCSKGFFFPATVMTGCTPDMTIMRDETFGPVLPVVPFTDEEEVVGLVNGISLALTNSIFSENSANAERLAHRLQSGVVVINDHLYSHGATESPWGGWKNSGIGRTHGYLGLKEMTNVKCINRERLPSCLVPRNLWWYPYTEDTFKVMMASLVFLAPRSFCEFLRGTMRIVGGCGYMFKKWKVQSSTPDNP